jgi:hypothetical protein
MLARKGMGDVSQLMNLMDNMNRGTSIRAPGKKQAKRHALHRSHIRPCEKDMGTQKEPGGGIHQTIWRPHPRMVRDAREHGIRNYPREKAEGMEKGMET